MTATRHAYGRWCARCHQLDPASWMLATDADAEDVLAAQSWQCSSCGGEAWLAARRLEDADLDGAASLEP